MNRLAGETSPYLLQHADNPVDWYPWGDEALTRAGDEDKPILLSVGYAACHWCHVMEHESFEDAATAAVMNEHFVNVKVDREERPDLDAVYMEAVVAMTGQGGWPMTVFLTPDGEPFYGGTYFPPEPRHGLPSFRQVLEALADAWRERRAGPHAVGGAARRGGAALEHAPALDRPADGEPARSGGAGAPARLRRGVGRLGPRAEVPARADDRVPPAPLPPHGRRASSCRWRRRPSTAWPSAACTTWSAAASTATPSTSAGSCRTSRRCSTTTPCSCPPISTGGWSQAGSATARSSRRPSSTCAASSGSRAAASPPRRTRTRTASKGLTFTWTEEEGVPAALLEPFEHGRSVIRGELDPDLRRRLFEERERRPKPLRDDKVIASWNGLALAALAEAGRRLERRDWVEQARLARRVPADVALGARRTAAPQLPGGPYERPRIPRRLRERRARAARAARRDRGAPLARGGEPARTARGRPLRRRGARRLLPRGSHQRAARGGDEAARRPSASFGQLDARARPPAAGAGSTATTSSSAARSRSSACWRPALERAPSAFGWALCALQPLVQPTARARDRRRRRGAGGASGARTVAARDRRRGRTGGRSAAAGREKRWSTAGPRSTSASVSPARRPSPTRILYNSRPLTSRRERCLNSRGESRVGAGPAARILCRRRSRTCAGFHSPSWRCWVRSCLRFPLRSRRRTQRRRRQASRRNRSSSVARSR